MKDFLWCDCPENVPPTCLTCPIFLNTKCPCIGIQRALLNVLPDVPGLTLSEWLSGKGIFRPEIFNNRLRIDKDPTIHLPDYMQCAAPQVCVTSSQSPTSCQAVVTEADNQFTFKELTSRIKKLAVTVQPKAHACLAQSLLEFSRRLQRFELDTHVAVTLQGRGQKSSIAHLHASAKGGAGRASKMSSDARRSSVEEETMKTARQALLPLPLTQPLQLRCESRPVRAKVLPLKINGIASIAIGESKTLPAVSSSTAVGKDTLAI